MPEIIAAVGPHPHPTDALRWAAQLADRTGDDLVVVTVFDQLYAEMDPDQHDERVTGREEQLHAVVAEASTRRARIEVLEGEPHSTLVRRAARDDVHYVVVGQHTTGVFGGEGTAHHLIHHLHRPVIAVRDGERFTRGPVLVGVDGSSTNAQALEAARRLAEALDAELVAAHCPDPMADSYPHPEQWTFLRQREVREELGDLLHPSSRLLIEPGHPTETLARLAEELDASALVVATRGRGGFHGLVAGRVATQLLRHAPVPLVIVPHSTP